jgi:hypothetical protein
LRVMPELGVTTSSDFEDPGRPGLTVCFGQAECRIRRSDTAPQL